MERELGECDLRQTVHLHELPRPSQYHPEWILVSVSGEANSLWLTEWLTAASDLRQGMRVLDLGCGRAASSKEGERDHRGQVRPADTKRQGSARTALNYLSAAVSRRSRLPNRSIPARQPGRRS